jgi:cytochrome c oxidase subunit II
MVASTRRIPKERNPPMRPPFVRLLATLAIASLAFAGEFAAVAARADALTTTKVVASNFTFTPAKITTRVGEKTTLSLTSSGGVHGLESKELGIPQTVMAPGKTVAVTFTPKKAGTYKIQCAIQCGTGHDKMVLEVVVKP